jgi:hypothetical protein
MPNKPKDPTTQEIGIFATLELSKNFDKQGVVLFCEQGHTCSMPSEQKNATTQ